MTRRRRSPPSAGFTLVEVCIAAMIVAIGSSAIFGIVLSVRQSLAASPVREQMHQYARQVSEDLRAYAAQYVDPFTFQPIIVGRPPLGWAYPNDNSGLRALDLGVHNVTSLLPSSLTGPYGATLGYNVSNANVGGNTSAALKIEVIMTWNEPD